MLRLRLECQRLVLNRVSKTFANTCYLGWLKKFPEASISIFFSKLEPEALRRRMALDCGLDKDLRSNDSMVYVRRVCKRAKEVEDIVAVMGRAKRHAEEEVEETEKKTKKKKHGKAGRRREADEKEGKDEKTQKPSLPKCLNPACSEFHLVRKCPKTSPEEATRLIDARRRQKNRDRAKRDSPGEGDGGRQVRRVAASSRNTNIFNVQFRGSDKVYTLCADTGSDMNLLPNTVLIDLEQDSSCLEVELVRPPVELKTILLTRSVNCSRKVTVDMSIRVRHAKRLVIKNLEFYVPDENISEVLLSDATLKRLGLDVTHTFERLCESSPFINADEWETNELQEVGVIRRFHKSKQLDIEYGSLFSNSNERSEEDDFVLDIGVNDPEEVRDHLTQRIAEARQQCPLDSETAMLLRELVMEYLDVFRVRIGPDKPAKVEPMSVRLKANARPSTVRARPYPIHIRRFINVYTAQLERFGFIEECPQSQWASPVLVVPKPPPTLYRWTADLRRVNQMTENVVWPMPHLDSEIHDLSGSQWFAKIDFVGGYWQLPLAEDSQEIMSFVVPQGIYKPTRTPQGAKQSAPNFQAKVEPLFSEIRSNLKAWLDDFLLHCSTFDDLLDKLRFFFSICREHRLFLSARKTSFVLTSATWCGRRLSATGWTLDPRRVSGLQDGFPPQTAGELCQFVHMSQWMATSIPCFAQVVSPLRELLEAAYTLRGGLRKKKRIQHLALVDQLAWGDPHQKAFEAITAHLIDAVNLSYRDDSKVLCVHTDASSRFWSGVVTQCAKSDLTLPTEEQRHEPLAFLGAKFDDTQAGWCTFEQESFAIFQAFKKMEYLLLATREAVNIFTDHRNLLFVFSPLSLEPNLGRHAIQKVQRWAIYLSQFHYDIMHIDGERNHCADMMTRWYRGFRPGKKQSLQVRRMARKRTNRVIGIEQIYQSPLSEDFDWPSKASIRQAQDEFPDDYPTDCIERDGVKCTMEGKYWIPALGHSLILRILIASHAGVMGHRGIEATKNSVSELFWWTSIDSDVKEFCQSCLFCQMTIGGVRVPRPLASTMHASRPGQILHMDYLYIGRSRQGYQYILMLKDDFSSYVRLDLAASADSVSAAQALSDWIATFTAPKMLVSDGGSHFKNEVIRRLRDEARIYHHITTPYVPWANGTVERVGREVLRALRALSAELRLPREEWPSLVKGIQSMLNNSQLVRLGLSPLKAFTGLEPRRAPLKSEPVTEEDTIDVRSIDHARAVQLLGLKKLQSSFEQVHKEVLEQVTKNRSRQISWHNRKVGVAKDNFEVGVFVLVGRRISMGEKLRCRWTGPRRVTSVINDQIYEVEDLITGKREKIHASRLIFFRNKDFQVTKDLKEIAEYTEQTRYEVKRLKDLIRSGDQFLVLVEWVGFPDDEDNSWESLDSLNSDIPEMVRAFLEALPQSRLRCAALTYLST